MAEDINGNPLLNANGNPITLFSLNSQGQAIVEVKTGGASLTSNQATVYPAVQAGAATPVGAKRQVRLVRSYRAHFRLHRSSSCESNGLDTSTFKADIYEICSEVAGEFPGWNFVSGRFKNGALKHSELELPLRARAYISAPAKHDPGRREDATMGPNRITEARSGEKQDMKLG